MSNDLAQRRLIIHADDAGLSASVNRATIQALERGLVTSTSILVPAPGFDEFSGYARSHLSGDFGVHLTLTSEWKRHRWRPITPSAEVSTLIDADGFLWPTVADVISHVELPHADRELTAQIQVALAAGIPVSHLDTHQGAMFSRRDLAGLYTDLARRFRLPCMVSRAQLDDPEIGRTLRAGLNRWHSDVHVRCTPILSQIAQVYEDLSLEQRKSRYLTFIREIGAGVSQLIVHCGNDDTELRAITKKSGLRECDLRLMLDPELRAELDQHRITRTTWRAMVSEPTL